MKKIIIVGNQFAEFANNQTIFTYDQFQYMLETEPSDSQNKYHIYIGQGLSDLKIASTHKILKSSVLADRFSFIGSMQRNKRAVSYFDPNKFIISEPEKMSEYLFKCYLMLDDSDDITEQHIQGTVLLEAVQQMVKSISTKFFISSLKNEKKSFVLNQVNSTFMEYVFPLDVEFIFKLEQFRYGLDDNFNAAGMIQVKQNKKIMMSVDIDFSIMEKNTLLNIESHMAVLAVNDIINGPNLRLVEQFAA
ncbi:MAG: hypothetical protein P4L79_17885 [Legionella sp.]|uniref:hypothetical protein n=1 Tax=Legionella sp. TaxID=459 RepID=UPI0028412620|nr:hypothetical protein [Legionella sp.]